MVGRATKTASYAYEPDYVTEPGDTLQETIDALGISQKELAARTGYSTKHINLLISGKARITPEAALRLEKVTAVPARFWNNLETQFQDRKARLANCSTAEQNTDWLDELPVKEMIKRRLLPNNASKPQLIETALSFFAVATVQAWHEGWSRHQIAFRKSAGAENCIGSIATWMRLAEIKAQEVDCRPFDATLFRKALQQIRGLTTQTPGSFVGSMRTLCAAAGVALVFIPEIPGGRVNGAARWLTADKALIAVNLRGKSNDKFWFTFFHEAGHVLNDDRDQVFVDVDYADDPREHQANEFAAEILIPPKYVSELPRLKSKVSVRAFANRIGIHPGIVVGRLRHEHIIPHTHMHDLTAKFTWTDD